MSPRKGRRVAAVVGLIVCGCDPAKPAATAGAGEPLPGITDAQRRDFEAGRQIFTRSFTAAEGLGPTFNEVRCASCHDLPTLGGAGADGVRKATRFADGRCDLLVEGGGDLLQTQVTAALRERGYDVEAVPPAATAVASIMPPALYAAGLIDAIPADAILEQADPDDADGDGISGRHGGSQDGRVGRFGRKAGFATVRDFVENAFLGEMGLTTPGSPNEHRIGGHPLPAGSDPAPDPELDDRVVDQVTQYVRLLAPPSPDATSAAARDSILAGRRIFDRIGCARCHRPELRTASNDLEPLRRRRVALYSDLLLHDMGPENASICAPGAQPAEWRTTPLLGLRLRIGFWHDGRAQSVESAISAHGGEGARARDLFSILAESQRSLLLRFLESL